MKYEQLAVDFRIGGTPPAAGGRAVSGTPEITMTVTDPAVPSVPVSGSMILVFMTALVAALFLARRQERRAGSVSRMTSGALDERRLTVALYGFGAVWAVLLWLRFT